MHSLTASFVLAYHGCDRAVGEKLLLNAAFKPSENDFDWLGSGVYFWESNPDRAMDWARECGTRKSLALQTNYEPFVVGAIIDLGFCLDLVTTNGLQAVEDSYGEYQTVVSASGGKLPDNAGGEDLLLRKLDCAVINFLHLSREAINQDPFDSVRGVFIEGQRLYKNSGFRHKTHIQICVRNSATIKGVFRVPDDHFSTG